MRHPLLHDLPTLGSAILAARQYMIEDGIGYTVTLRGEGEWCVMSSEHYAKLREANIHREYTPLMSFLPNGTLDTHRASFAPVAAALINHERY